MGTGWMELTLRPECDPTVEKNPIDGTVEIVFPERNWTVILTAAEYRKLMAQGSRLEQDATDPAGQPGVG